MPNAACTYRHAPASAQTPKLFFGTRKQTFHIHGYIRDHVKQHNFSIFSQELITGASTGNQPNFASRQLVHRSSTLRRLRHCTNTSPSVCSQCPRDQCRSTLRLQYCSKGSHRSRGGQTQCMKCKHLSDPLRKTGATHFLFVRLNSLRRNP